MPKQLRIEAFSCFFAPEWKPRAATLARVKNYLEGYPAHGRTIGAGVEHMAAKLKIGQRTLARYLAHLVKIGWLETIRTIRTAIRKVLFSKATGSSSGRSIEVKPEASQNLPKQNTVNAPCSDGEPDKRPACAPESIPVGYPEPFREYMRPFVEARKPLNRYDWQRAYGVWGGIDPAEWGQATTDARRVCRETRHVRFVPLPVYHLLDHGWTRVAAPAVLGTCDNGWAWNDPRWSELGD